LTTAWLFFLVGLSLTGFANTGITLIHKFKSLLFPLYHASLKVIVPTHIKIHTCTIGEER
jgi:hypothetical protein